MKTSAAIQVIVAVAECIRALEQVPAGELFARLCAMPLFSQMTADQFAALIGTLKGADLVAERNHLLTWIGPKAVQS